MREDRKKYFLESIKEFTNSCFGDTMSERPVLIIGKKEPKRYVLACLTFFHNGAKEVEVRARGKAISKAVDVVLTVKNVFMRDVVIKDVSIGSEYLATKNGLRAISNIKIILARGELS